jgi:hypothetical protein
MNRFRLLSLCALLTAALPASSATPAPSNEELRLSGECSSIGVFFTRNRAGFPKSWH